MTTRETSQVKQAAIWLLVAEAVYNHKLPK